MPCYHPLTAFQTESGDIVFSERGKIRRELTLACGQCFGCRLERSRQWAVRCMHEASLHEANSFITLTYSDAFIPHDSSLDYRHYQLFMKRLRRTFKGRRIRFYMCGEYGDRTKRPHYHACLFGIDFADKVYFRKSDSGFPLYRSDVLERLWPHGHCELGAVSFESAAYVARYIMKKVNGSRAEDHYSIVDGDTGEIFQRSPEFTKMSLKPGIGYEWIRKYWREVFPRDKVVVRGKEAIPPRYYKKFLDDMPGTMSDAVEFQRAKLMELCAWDNTPERLAVRKQVALSRTKSLIRSVE